MHNSLNTLIKLHRRRLDELRRKLTGLEQQKAQLLALSARLSEELARELEQAYRQPEMSGFFGDFSRRIRKRQEIIAKEVMDLAAKIVQATVEITEGYSELKKFEIAREHALKREREEEDRKEIKVLDEVARQQYLRKSE